MLQMLVKACPSFAEKWEEHNIEYADEEDFLPYVALGELADHLIHLHDKGNVDEVESVFAVVERLHIDGEHYVQEAATIGLLESIQNVIGNRNRDPEIFRNYLLPVSAKWWDQLNLFWNGEIKYVGETIDIK